MSVYELCEHCFGSGERDPISGAKCYECSGRGMVDIDIGPEDDEPWEEDDEDPGAECGRWRNGSLKPYSWCLLAGTEFCDFECPYR